jgi:hypothetical protein
MPRSSEEGRGVSEPERGNVKDLLKPLCQTQNSKEEEISRRKHS